MRLFPRNFDFFLSFLVFFAPVDSSHQFRKPFFVFVIVALVGVYFGLHERNSLSTDSGSLNTITSFEECAAAGNPMMESYPEQCRTADGKYFVRDIGNEFKLSDIIQIHSPRPGDTISSPLTVRGEARGYWFFEASFPIRLESSDGIVVTEHYATAEDAWMTEEFVPFVADISFASPEQTSGNLLLLKANASELPEHDATLRVPVRFND